MNIRKHVAAIVVAGVTTGIFAVHATNTTLNISGNVAASVCTISFSKSIKIGVFSSKDFPTPGSITTFKAMSINLTDCYSKLTKVQLKFSGVVDRDDPTLLAITDGGSGAQLATGVGVELLDNAMETISFNDEKTLSYDLEEGMTMLSFLLRYKSTRYPVTSGEASALLNFDVVYQ